MRNTECNSKNESKRIEVYINRISLEIKGMTCAECGFFVESTLRKVEGVTNVSLKYDDELAHVESKPEDPSVEQLVKAINQIGYSAKKSK